MFALLPVVGGLLLGRLGRARPPGQARATRAGSVQLMGKLVRRTIEGDSTVLEWSPDDEGSVRRAAETMRDQVAAGYVAVLGGDGRNEPIDELPPDADLIVLTMPMGGG